MINYEYQIKGCIAQGIWGEVHSVHDLAGQTASRNLLVKSRLVNQWVQEYIQPGGWKTKWLGSRWECKDPAPFLRTSTGPTLLVTVADWDGSGRYTQKVGRRLQHLYSFQCSFLYGLTFKEEMMWNRLNRPDIIFVWDNQNISKDTNREGS